MCINVSGFEIEIINYFGYLNDFERYAENDIKNDAYAVLVDYIDGYFEYWADGFYIPTKLKNVLFYFESVGEDWEKEKKGVFVYMGVKE